MVEYEHEDLFYIRSVIIAYVKADIRTTWNKHLVESNSERVMVYASDVMENQRDCHLTPTSLLGSKSESKLLHE